MVIKEQNQKNNKKYVYYKYVCQHRDKLNNCTAEELNKDEVEDLVINELKRVLLNPSNIDKIVDKINQKYSKLYNSSKTDMQDTEKEIKDVQNLEIYFKFSSSIDNTVKQAKRNERDNSFVCLAPLERSITNIK